MRSPSGLIGLHRAHAALSAESCLSGPCSTMVPNSSSVFLPAERALPRFVLPVGQVEVERLLRVATSCRHRHHEQGGPTDATGLTQAYAAALKNKVSALTASSASINQRDSMKRLMDHIDWTVAVPKFLRGDHLPQVGGGFARPSLETS